MTSGWANRAQSFLGILFLFVALTSGSQVKGASAIIFSADCAVVKRPEPSSQVACHEKRGVTLRLLAKAPQDYYKVQTAQCQGFVPRYCLRKLTLSPTKDRKTASNSGEESLVSATVSEEKSKSLRAKTNDRVNRQVRTSETIPFHLGALANFGVLWGKPSASGGASRGNDFGFSLLLGIPLGGSLRFLAFPRIQKITLNRSVDGSGVIVDPNPVTFSQSVLFAGVGATVGIHFFGDIDFQGNGETWWWDLGAEYLLPLSAKQTDTLGNEISFTTDDKIFFLTTGPSGQFGLTPTLNVNAQLQFLYNLGSQNGSQILGARLQLGMDFLL